MYTYIYMSTFTLSCISTICVIIHTNIRVFIFLHKIILMSNYTHLYTSTLKNVENIKFLTSLASDMSFERSLKY